MIDHTGVSVSNYPKSRDFYVKALGAIGYKLLVEFPAAVTGTTDVAGFGEPPKPDFWVGQGTPNRPALHIAFRVSNRALVDQFTRLPWQRAERTTAPQAETPLSPKLLRRLCA